MVHQGKSGSGGGGGDGGSQPNPARPRHVGLAAGGAARGQCISLRALTCSLSGERKHFVGPRARDTEASWLRF